MKVTAKISGMTELRAALGQLPRATERSVVRKVLMRRAKPIADTARSLAPVDTGHLRDSIAVTTKLSRRHRKALKNGKKDTNVHIGASSKAHLQEFGTREHAPQPFMRPAWDAHKGGILDGIGDDIWLEIEKALKRKAKRDAKLAAGV